MTIFAWHLGATVVQALAGDIVLCSCARHLTLTVLLSTQVYKWVLANLMEFQGHVTVLVWKRDVNSVLVARTYSVP